MKTASLSISDITKLSHEIKLMYNEKKWLDLAKTSMDWYKKTQE